VDIFSHQRLTDVYLKRFLDLTRAVLLLRTISASMVRYPIERLCEDFSSEERAARRAGAVLSFVGVLLMASAVLM
jgi:hypothetical protein